MFNLTKCTSELLDSAKSDWIAMAGGLGELGPFVCADVERKFLGIEKEDKQSSDFHVYCLVDNSDGAVKSLLEIMHAQPTCSNGWLKLLDITLSPDLTFNDDGVLTEELAKKALAVLANSIAWSISLIFKDFHGAGSIKIYGRTGVMREMFVSLLSTGELDSALSPIGVSARKESAWLVFEKKI